MRHLSIAAAAVAVFGYGPLGAQPTWPATPGPGTVVVTGTVPDEASKAAMLQRLRELYGAERVVDQIGIGNVALTPNWSAHVQKLIGPSLKLISKGELKVEGTTVTLRGEVANEALRQQIASDAATSLNPTYTVNNGLRVGAVEQALLDATLASRIVEFESGQAEIRLSGKEILDQMAGALHKMKGKKVEVIGHTDNVGPRGSNVALSLARAEAVRSYLEQKGISPGMIEVSGQGPDRPVADNAASEGRARNRRIEFRIAQ